MAAQDSPMIDNIFLKEGERIDDLMRSSLRIIQDPGDFCFGMDAVLLSGYVRPPKGADIVDLGTGSGIIPLLVWARHKDTCIKGLELRPDAVDMASRSVAMNGLEDRISIIEGDLKQAAAILGRGIYDVVTSNPPYMKTGAGLRNPHDRKALARHEIACTLDDVAREAAALLKEGGLFYLVHRPLRLPEIIRTLSRYRLEPKRMRLVHPYIDKEANMVLLEARKGSGPELRTDPPLIVYKEQGVYTEEIYEIYGY